MGQRFDDLFSPVVLNERGQEKLAKMRAAFVALIKEFETLGIDGQEWQMVTMKLQEASFYGARAISMQPGNQE